MIAFLQLPVANGRNELDRFQRDIDDGLEIERDRLMQKHHHLRLNHEAFRAHNGALSMSIEHFEDE